MYSSDASLYRVPPLAVVRPRHADEVAATLEVARGEGVPLTARGAGTSIAGNAVGPGIVLDFSRHLNRVLEVDPEARSARVQPGLVHAVLQRAVQPHGLRFGPDPSSHSRCTVGGMIGNNACGNRALAHGRTSDNVWGTTHLLASGAELVTGYDSDGTGVSSPGAAWHRGADEVVAAVRSAIGAHLGVARTEFDRFGRQLSGYAVHHLLPERFDLTRALVGSEGTLGVLTEATVRLVHDPAHVVLVALGFDDIVAAGRAAPAVLQYAPTACEGLDVRLVEVLRQRRGAGAVPPLPRGTAWLFVEIAGDEPGEVHARAAALAASGLGVDALVVKDPAVRATLWRIREAGAGLAGTAPSGHPAWPVLEDAAVPPERLGDYLAAFDTLVAAHSLTCAPYGHFGDGCLHVRLDLPLERPDGLTRLRSFLTEAADLVAQFGGSLSGEHGDGRARSELLPRMYSAEAVRLFGAVKHAFDPDNLLNPGVLVDPEPLDAHVRVGPSAPLPVLALAHRHDGGDLARAVHRCTGVGACRADTPAAGGVMCPSFVATREEKDSTRGRARVLQEVVRGELAFSDPAVHEALDLCLACKGCAVDCPTGVDMASYKAEVLHQTYRGRLRPRAHYVLGRLPVWARLAGRAPRVANLVLRTPGLAHAARWVAGVDQRRSLPSFAIRPFRRHPSPGVAGSATAAARSGRSPVVLFVDSFSDSFDPAVAHAVVRVLRAAGHEPFLPGPPATGTLCCGLTWITTGQLDQAKQTLGETVAVLAEAARDGLPIVGIEPSCTAVLRADVLDLLPDSADAALVAAQVRTLAELLGSTPGWVPPDLSDTTLVVQPHCHHHAVLGWEADRALLAATGATLQTVSGCCGLAGNFGVEQGHHEISVAVAEQHLLPALDVHPQARVLADGFSCRTQVAGLRGRVSVHLAQLLAEALPPER